MYNLNEGGNRLEMSDSVNGSSTYTPNNLNQDGETITGTEHETINYQSVNYTYLADTHLARVTNANGDAYELGYDAFGRTASGNYSLKTAAGNYQIIAAQSGFVFNLGAASTITVRSGSFVTGQTATLTASARTISGTLRDAGTLAGLPGIAMQGQSNCAVV